MDGASKELHDMCRISDDEGYPCLNERPCRAEDEFLPGAWEMFQVKDSLGIKPLCLGFPVHDSESRALQLRAPVWLRIA